MSRTEGEALTRVLLDVELAREVGREGTANGWSLEELAWTSYRGSAGVEALDMISWPSLAVEVYSFAAVALWKEDCLGNY